MLLEAAFLLALAGYLYAIHVRMRGPDRPNEFTPEQLDKVRWDDIDLTANVPPATHKGYAVVGGSGFVGTYLVRLLILRGESSIRIIDLRPPTDPTVLASPAVTFEPADITSPHSVSAALRTPFPATGAPPSVVFHTAASIRFWERAWHAWPLSFNVNVLGTQNVVAACRDALPRGTVLVYTSTCDVVLAARKFCRLGFDRGVWPWSRKVLSDGDAPLGRHEAHQSNYTQSKMLAERVVLDANGQNGMRVGILRPGYTITGPNDRLLASSLTLPRIPTIGHRFKQTSICVWDVAAAHLCLAHRLSPDTQSPARAIRDVRSALAHFARRALVLDDVPEAILFVLAHLVEALLFVRFWALVPVYRLLWGGGARPGADPGWMGEGVYLQPPLFEFLEDCVVDDARARRVLGYEPQWTVEATAKYAVDTMAREKAGGGHGLQMKR
ncbi:NAD(P)-binding protein [Coniophora puteana RWD-64-598 SS2]|uniref:NAD(P)-binding protein n=1 Tax=Coniophora puteana (strain RWD-64-598) TaxID=741705 RepID=A0A5M3MRW4_CONPW|nr:NAD(P)-binding protein [Coniophora puteana RWD-64-598 SS2]EIW81395.1 NAD(P)-binding protein [Coniophora puteana RWD-64-598 SS2]